jgi:sec-independent protein translocase protein TatA
MNTLGFLNSLWSTDGLLILVLGLLIFGNRLPEVGKSLGKGIVEFKKGLKGIDEDIEEQSNRPARRNELPEQERQYRAPLTDGQERRVSREDVVSNDHPHQAEPSMPAQPRAEH